MTKPLAAFLTVALTVAIFLPVHESFRGDYGDSFPFSWYPMFSRPRPKLEPARYLIGLEPDGTRHVLHKRYYVRGSMNQARRQVNRLAKKKATARKMCKKAAKRIATLKKGQLSRVTQVRVMKGHFDMKRYFHEGKKLPEREKVLARCKVKREPAAQEGSQ